MDISETRMFFYCLSILQSSNKTINKIILENNGKLFYGDFLKNVDFKDENKLVRKKFCADFNINNGSITPIYETINCLLKKPYKLFNKISEFIRKNNEYNLFIKNEDNIVRDVTFLNNKAIKFDSFLFNDDDKFVIKGIISNDNLEQND